MKKIKWNRVLTLITLFWSSYVVLHDLYYIIIKPWFTGEMYGWTFIGIITFIISLFVMISAIESFIEWWNE